MLSDYKLRMKLLQIAIAHERSLCAAIKREFSDEVPPSGKASSTTLRIPPKKEILYYIITVGSISKVNDITNLIFEGDWPNIHAFLAERIAFGFISSIILFLFQSHSHMLCGPYVNMIRTVSLSHILLWHMYCS